MIVIGLGNSGIKYKKTRHNVGHQIVDLLGNIDGMILLKTDCFMNKSGGFVKRVLQENKLEPKDLLIIHDDWAFEVGEYRLQFDRNANRHRGVENIIDVLKTKAFWRLRVGIGSYSKRGLEAGSDYVLENFNTTDLKKITALVPELRAKISTLVKEGV